MADQIWTVTHATATGEWRSWTVTEQIAVKVDMGIDQACDGQETELRMSIRTTTGRVLIWLTPGQSLTVEKAR